MNKKFTIDIYKVKINKRTKEKKNTQRTERVGLFSLRWYRYYVNLRSSEQKNVKTKYICSAQYHFHGSD